jgi:hypothetical protein
LSNYVNGLEWLLKKWENCEVFYLLKILATEPYSVAEFGYARKKRARTTGFQGGDKLDG